MSKTGPVTAIAGTNVTYTITVLNAGPVSATAVSLTDATPPGLTLVSVTGACTALPCSLGTLADDETRTVSVTYAIPVNYSGADPIVNTATVTTTSQDTFPDNNSASASTALGAPVADLMITKTNGVSGVVVGTTTTYTITVTNAGPSTAANAVVTDTFPAALTGVSWSCVGTGGAVCGAPAGTGHINSTVTVPVNGTLTFTATGTIDPASTGTIVNTAQVVPAAGTSDPTPAIATDSDPIELRADLSVTKTGPATVVAGDDITYTITVHNAGPSAAADVLVDDVFPSWSDLRVHERPLHGLAVQPRDACCRRDGHRADHVCRARQLQRCHRREHGARLEFHRRPEREQQQFDDDGDRRPERGRGDRQAASPGDDRAARRGCDLLRDRDQSRSRACHRRQWSWTCCRQV